jgi:hypothetical protein
LQAGSTLAPGVVGQTFSLDGVDGIYKCLMPPH